MFADKRCAIHPSRAALSFCQCCKEFFCEYCLTEARWVPEAAVTLRALRQETMRKLNYSLPPRAIFRLVFSV